MDAADIAYAGLARQAELVRTGEVSSRELTQLCLDRIDTYDGRLNAFRTVYAERALLEAEQADARRKGAENRPLLGVPVAIKDEVKLAGDFLGYGTNAFGGPDSEDAEIVRRLRDAGAVIIGKTNCPELTIHPFTESPTWGVTRNPWDVQRTPGGSSGGSSAAVAAGLVGAAFAADGGGSIRIPAGCCGLFGLKPQRDRISTAPKRDPWQGLTVYGTVTRRVADSALFDDVVRGGGSEWSQAAAQPPGKLRVAVSTGVPPSIVTKVDDEQRGAVARMADALRSLGHEVFEREIDYPPLAVPNFSTRYLRGIADDAAAMAHPERLSRRTKGYVRLGRLVTEWQLRQALEAGAGADAQRLNSIFEHADVVLTPMFTQRPVPVGAWDGWGALRTFLLGDARFVPFCAVWNHTGQPAMSVPAGFTGDGFPLAAQIVGRPDDEPTLLALAGQLEAEIGWPERRPPGFA
jgi:amidase